ncbi:hypothetical protein [Actinoplanes teichomyceticus]|uniref:Uncharacterized protein n=1 Tax=Actinoplanes teichomyceticus TaxID=1867 RepID=A0A561WA85_ACTTI|nr:hypothetical protein [Actinoplanes teichomyceticus]TWG20762.1 hypothetical protein FHX34_103291 [Actinoplanes teichomyceticus]GIF14418.1 hypothetical protein Ate01nite_44500 [Actinoplanes teichomyceticus]
MSIGIGTSTPSSAWATHAAWLRLREDCQQLFGHVVRGADRSQLDEDRIAVLRSRDEIARLEPGGGVVDILV